MNVSMTRGLVASLLVAALSAVAQQSQPMSGSVIDSEVVARGLLNFGRTDHYDCGFSSQRADGTWSQGSCKMNSKGQITALVIDSVTIPIPADKPLPGLPMYGAVMNNFGLYLNAYDPNGYQKAYGSYYTQSLTASSVIDVVLTPGQVHKFVSYTPPAGVDASLLRMSTADGNVYYFDNYRGGFIVWLSPLSGIQDYSIYRADTGDVLTTGDIGPNTPVSTDTSKVVNTRYLGNVVDAAFPVDPVSGLSQDYVALDDVSLNGNVTVNGTNCAAKVITIDLAGDGGLMLNISDPNVIVTVKVWAQEGDLTQEPMAVYSRSIYGQTVYTADQGLGKLIVTLTNPQGLSKQQYYVSLVRYRGTVVPGKG